MSKQQILDAPVKLVEFGVVEAGLSALHADLAGVQFDVATTEGNKAARAARQRCVSIRTAADKAYSDWNKPMLEKQRVMRDKLQEIKESVKEVEGPIDAQIKAEEKRKAEEKAERERIEAERLARIQFEIDAIKNMAIHNVGKPPKVLAAAIEMCQAIEVTLDSFDSRAGEAEIVKQQTLAQLTQMHAAAIAHEAEQEKLAAERTELERLRKEQEQRDAEAKAKADAEEAKRQAALDEQQETLQAQQAELERQRLELEAAQAAAQRAEEERLAAIEQEKREQELEAQREAEAKAQAEREEKERREQVQFEQNGPGDAAIIEVLALHYRVHESAVITWLVNMDLEAASQELSKEFS